MSSNILHYTYDSFNKILTIYFFGGGRYEYLSLPYEVYDGLVQSKAKGKYFNDYIKDKYETKKIY